MLIFYGNSNKLVVSKIKHETAGVAIKTFVALIPKNVFVFADASSEHEKEKGVNKNVVAAISHNEYKDVLMNSNSLLHSVNRIQSKKQNKSS